MSSGSGERGKGRVGDLHNPPHKREEIEAITANYSGIAEQNRETLLSVEKLKNLKASLGSESSKKAVEACEAAFVLKASAIEGARHNYDLSRSYMNSFGGMQEYEFIPFKDGYEKSSLLVEELNKNNIPKAIGALAQEMTREVSAFTKSLTEKPPQSEEEIRRADQFSSQLEENYKILMDLARPYQELHESLSASAAKMLGEERGAAPSGADSPEVDHQAELRRQEARERVAHERASKHEVSVTPSPPIGASTSIGSPFEVVVAAPVPREVGAPAMHRPSDSEPLPGKPSPHARAEHVEPQQDFVEHIQEIIHDTPNRNEASGKVSDFVEHERIEGRVRPLQQNDFVRNESAGADSKIYEFNVPNLGNILPENSTCMFVKRLKHDGTPHTDNGKIIQDVIYLDGKGNVTGFEIIHDEPPTASIGPETRKELALMTAKYKESHKHDVAESRVAAPSIDPTSTPSRSDSGAIMGDDEAERASAATRKAGPLGDVTNLETPAIPTKADGSELGRDVAAQAKAAAKICY